MKIKMKVWKLLGMAVLAGAVIWAGIAVIGKLSNPNSATSAGEGQVVEAKLGNVEATISASGYLVAHSKAMLSFDSAGIIADMAVEVGSRVTRGQVLAKLDTSSLERAVAQAEAGLRTDQINLDKARNPYTETDFTQAEAAVTQAEAGLRTAQINLDKAQDLGNALKAVITARVALNVAQDALEEAKIGVLAAVRDAEVAVANAREDLIIATEAHAITLRASRETLVDEEDAYIELIEAHYGSTISRVSIHQSLVEQIGRAEKLIPLRVKDAHQALQDVKSDFNIDSARAAKAIADAGNSVAQAEDTLQNAHLDAADTLEGTEPFAVEIKSLQVESARITLRKAEADLALIKEGQGSQDVQLKQIQLDNARVSLSKEQGKMADMRAGPDSKDIELKEIQLSNGQIALANAVEKLEKATIVAPFDGLVASVDHEEGNRVGAGAVIVQLIDPNEFEVEAILDEMDVFRIRVGQTARVSLDALPQVGLEGTVKSISPMAQREAGVISYQAVIGVQHPGHIRLRDGLTAAVEIVIATHENVLLLPSRAVSRNGRDNVIKVMVEGKPEERVVTTGLSQDGQTEILEGISQGDQVLMPTSTSTSTSASSQSPPAGNQPRGGGGFFGPGGGGSRVR